MLDHREYGMEVAPFVKGVWNANDKGSKQVSGLYTMDEGATDDLIVHHTNRLRLRR